MIFFRCEYNILLYNFFFFFLTECVEKSDILIKKNPHS